MLPTSFPSTPRNLNNIGFDSNEARVMANTGLITSLLNYLPQDSVFSQPVTSWFAGSETKTVVNFIDQIDAGHGADESNPVSFLSTKGDLIQVWNSVSDEGEKELNYKTNDGDVIVTKGSVVLLRDELAHALHLMLNHPELSAEDRELFEKINLHGIPHSVNQLLQVDGIGSRWRSVIDIESCLRSVLQGDYSFARYIPTALERMLHNEDTAEHCTLDNSDKLYSVVTMGRFQLHKCGLDNILNSPQMVKKTLKMTYYHMGEILREKNSVMATLHFIQAAELGCVRSQKTAEVRYAKEEGIKDSKAFCALINDCKRQDPAANYKHAKMREKLGDAQRAVAYYKIAASQGYFDALARTKVLQERLTLTWGCGSN
jgi:hypothetical protein